MGRRGMRKSASPQFGHRGRRPLFIEWSTAQKRGDGPDSADRDYRSMDLVGACYASGVDRLTSSSRMMGESWVVVPTADRDTLASSAVWPRRLRSVAMRFCDA